MRSKARSQREMRLVDRGSNAGALGRISTGPRIARALPGGLLPATISKSATKAYARATKALSQAASPDKCACCRGTKSLPYKRLAPGERRLRALLVVITFVAAVGAAQPQSLRVVGTAGYVSEWELSGETAPTVAGPIKEFAGSLTLKHVGLCSRDGPQEETGEIKFRIVGSGSLAKIKATLLYLGTRCTYTAKLSNSISHGFMQCSDVNGIPLTLIVSNR
jgi:hypothetical protein